jgi:hypothetical protein
LRLVPAVVVTLMRAPGSVKCDEVDDDGPGGNEPGDDGPFCGSQIGAKDDKTCSLIVSSGTAAALTKRTAAMRKMKA